MTIVIPVIDAILGKDIITGETLNDFERGMKAAGAVIDLFTLGQAMVLAGGVEAGAGIIVKTLAVEMVSNAAGYSAGYAANEMGMPLPVTWILSVATGCTVSATVGGYLFTSADGTITKCTAEEAGDLIKRLDTGGSVTLSHQATSCVELTSTSGKTTTILGRYDSDTGDIIKELCLPKSTDFSGNPGGFNLLNTPDDLYTKLGSEGFWNEYNKPFLDAAISRGDEILMSTPINNSTLYTKFGELTGYGREYYYLLSKGYEYVDGKMVFKGVK